MSEELKQAQHAYYAEGGARSASMQAALEQAEQKAHAEARDQAAPANAWAADLIKRSLGWLATLFFVVALIAGTLVLFVAVIAAEYVAVYEGLLVVTPVGWISSLTTLALFVGMLVMSFVKCVYEDALPQGKPTSGLRRYAAKVGTWVGLNRAAAWDTGRVWTQAEQRYMMLGTTLTIVKVSVILASMLGRLRTTFLTYGELPLREAITAMQANVTGLEVFGALVSGVVLWALISLVDRGVMWSHMAFRSSVGRLDLAEVQQVDFLASYEALRDQYQAKIYQEATTILRARKQARQEATPTENT